MKTRHLWLSAGVALLALVLAGGVGALLGTSGKMSAEAASVPALDDRPQPNPLKNAYFGDLHVHTKTSVDSFLRRNMLTMADAYRFAQGAEVTTATGQKVRLKRPLDFMALTDHSESYATYDLCIEGNGIAAQTASCKAIKSSTGSQIEVGAAAGRVMNRTPENCGGDIQNCLDAVKKVWRYVQQLAAENYKPGVFTSLIGYEYSAGVKGVAETSGHMHRNVIFGNTNVPDTVFSAIDGPRNYQLWKWLEQSCVAPCDVIAIPHNTNLSLGYQFALETVDGTKYDDDDWRRRAQFERLVEVHQIKGNSECAIGFGTTDEDCNFEAIIKTPCGNGTPGICAKDTSFVRNALKEGLGLKDQLGFNPFHLGFIGSSDTHDALPGSASITKDWPGSVGLADGYPEKRLTNPGALARNPGGLAGVWAPQNTRDAIFAALKNRETFATTGTRIKVRFFGGWSLPANMDKQADWIAQGYKIGVPMGGDLPARGSAKAPTFVVWAARDPDSVKLARIQIVKGWSGKHNEDEAVYDIACSGGAKPDAKTHRCSDNGASVDLSNCNPSNGPGDDQMSVTWTDPDFDPKIPAFYYVKVYENPTCRWSTYDAIKLHQPPPPMVPPASPERAWSSPIWYDFRPDRLSGL